jgi:hypothetical protein
MSHLSPLNRELVNLSQGNAKLWGMVSAPIARTGTEAFGPPQRMLHARRGSVAQAGDIVMDLGERYVLGFFNQTASDAIFRMYRLPFLADVRRMVTTADPVSGFPRNTGEQTVARAWYDLQPNGFGKDLDKLNRAKYRLITGFALKVGDVLDGHKVVSVSLELGVNVAEAE